LLAEVVNTRQPASFKIRRKTNVVVETQDAKSTNVQVPLDQHFSRLNARGMCSPCFWVNADY